MNRKEFTLSQQERFPFTPEIMSHVPEFVSVGKGCHIAKNVIFAPHGFGYEKINEDWVLIPHSGKIVLMPGVYIHENTVIVRATATDGITIIGAGTKVDTFVHVAHNVKIGSNCLITSGAIIGGSCEIGNDVYIGINATIRNKIKIGDGATIGMGAVVTRDVPPGVTVVGNPAKELKK